MARTMQKGLGKGLGALLGDTSPLSSAPAAEGRGHGAKNQPAVKPAKPL